MIIFFKVPSMINVKPRTLPTNLFHYNFNINHNQGFHPKFNTSINLSKKSRENCPLYVLYTLPNSFYVDVYHLHELYPEKYITIWGEKDLEIPAGFPSTPYSTPLKWGSLVLANEHIFERNNNNQDDNGNNNDDKSNGNDGNNNDNENKENDDNNDKNDGDNDNNDGNINFEFILPVRVRYHQAVPRNNQKTHVTVEAPQPMVVCVCNDDDGDDDDKPGIKCDDNISNHLISYSIN